MILSNLSDLLQILPFRNLDLLLVGVTVAAITLFGFTAYFNNSKSISNKSFLFFALSANFYGIVNYISYQGVESQTLALWCLRLVIFSAVWYAYGVFRFIFVFPHSEIKFPFWYKFFLFPIVSVTSIFNLTPLVFKGLASVSLSGEAPKVIVGPLILLFIVVASGLVLGGILLLIKKIRFSSGSEKQQLRLIAVGCTISYSLIVTFNMLFPTLFSYVRLIPFAPLFTLPFIFFTFYAIYKHKLFNVRNILSAMVTFSICLAAFLEVIFADTTSLIIFRSGIFVLTLAICIQFIRNLYKLEFTNDQLGSANEKLKLLDQQKTEFLSIASHQLRSPLTAIKGYSSMLLEGSFGKLEEQSKKAVEVIYQSSQKLVLVIEDFLNITRIELGKMKYTMVDFDLKEMVETVMREMKPTVESRGLSLALETDIAGHYPTHADLGKLSQVFGNLLDNAMKYTRQGGIVVRLSRDLAGKNRLTVKDTGVGLDQQTIGNLFQKFARADDAGKINSAGTGLGLFVAKQIMEAHNGKIWAESEGPGKGSSFIVEL